MAGSAPVILTEEESKPAEQFIFLCWTRHSHTLVQELMESTKQYVAEKQYNEALAALSEVLSNILIPEHLSRSTLCGVNLYLLFSD